MRHALPAAVLVLLASALADPVACAVDSPADRSPVRAGTDSGQSLLAPVEAEEFSFVIFGDRTGGKPEGIRVLAEAVEMSNRLDPAFVMTVGDLVEGYNAAEPWLRQMREYKDTIGALRMPWYPVVGNHDIYDSPRTADGHIDLYKEHFGPLYYSFDYRWAHFVCLFSDEALSFSNPAVTQNMGSEQMRWLREDLAATTAEQVFVFLHHPRWNYAGCNWPDVHRILAEDGRVVAVIAGHVHEYRDDGVQDGIHYYTMATTGAHRGALHETAAFDHINLVRVRHDRIAMCALPVGSVLGSDVVLGTEVDEMRGLTRAGWLAIDGSVALDVDGDADSRVTLSVHNPTDRPLDYEFVLTAPKGWSLSQAETAGTLAPGASAAVPVDVHTTGLATSTAPRLRLSATLDYPLASGLHQPIRSAVDVPIRLEGIDRHARARPNADHALALDGQSAVRVELGKAADDLEAFTLEGWVRGAAPAGRACFLAKTENSAFGIFWNDPGGAAALPVGYAHIRGHGYIHARAERPWDWNAWTHVALVYDGARLTLYVNGEPRGSTEQAGRITPNRKPFFVGADPNGQGQATSFFTGEIDEVRISSVARYGRAFTPARHHERDADTLLLMHFDVRVHGVFPDDSGRGHHGWAVGGAALVPAKR